jgi:hypothetical protein
MLVRNLPVRIAQRPVDGHILVVTQQVTHKASGCDACGMVGDYGGKWPWRAHRART